MPFLSYDLPNPFGGNEEASQGAAGQPRSIRAGLGGGDAQEPLPPEMLPGLQIGALGQMLDVVTFMAELLCDPSYVEAT